MIAAFVAEVGPWSWWLLGLALLAGGFNMWWIAAVIWGSAVLLVMSRNRGGASNPVAVRS